MGLGALPDSKKPPVVRRCYASEGNQNRSKNNEAYDQAAPAQRTPRNEAALLALSDALKHIAPVGLPRECGREAVEGVIAKGHLNTSCKVCASEALAACNVAETVPTSNAKCLGNCGVLEAEIEAQVERVTLAHGQLPDGLADNRGVRVRCF